MPEVRRCKLDIGLTPRVESASVSTHSKHMLSSHWCCFSNINFSADPACVVESVGSTLEARCFKPGFQISAARHSPGRGAHLRRSCAASAWAGRGAS